MFTIIACPAQSQWSKAIGGTGGEFANSIVQTTDGGFAVAGGTTSYGAGAVDMYIVKLNLNGSIQWTTTIGGTYNDKAESVIQSSDGGYVLAGYTQTFGAGGFDAYIAKLNSSGILIWSKSIGGPNDETANSIIQTTDGGYAMTGSVFSYGAGAFDIYILKFDANGTFQWSKTLGGSQNEHAYSIIQISDGSYIVAGSTTSFGQGAEDMYIVKLSSNGIVQWSITEGGPGDDEALSLIKTTDGGFAAAGWTNSFGAGNYDLYIIKLDASGSLQWSKTIGGADNDYAYSIIQSTDGGYAIAGGTFSFGAGLEDIYIVKLASDGSLQWSKTIGGSNYDEAHSIIQTTDGGYAIAGYTSSFGTGTGDMYIVKLDANGNACGNSSSPPSISGTGGTLGTTNPIVTSPNSNVSSPASVTTSGGTVTNICVTGIEPIQSEIPKSFNLFQNYPNPFNPTTNIGFRIADYRLVNLTVFDALGREVAVIVNENLKPGVYEVTWNATNKPSGVYFYKLETGNYTDIKKMILIK